MGHTCKRGSHLKEEWVAFEKIGHTWKGGSHLEKWVTFRKMVIAENLGYTWKS